MKKLVFRKKNEKYCSHCVHATCLEYTGEIFCAKKGFVNEFGSCIRYKYDPLKRKPQQQAVSRQYSADDFKL